MIWGRWNEEESKQLEVNDLVCMVGENVKRAHHKKGRVLEMYYGSNARAKSTLMKTEDEKLKIPVLKLAPLIENYDFNEENRAGDVGASRLQDTKLDIEHSG